MDPYGRYTGPQFTKLQVLLGATLTVIGLIFIGWATGGGRAKEEKQQQGMGARKVRKARAVIEAPFPAPKGFEWITMETSMMLKPVKWKHQQQDATHILQKSDNLLDSMVSVTVFKNRDTNFITQFLESLPQEIVRSGDKVILKPWTKEDTAKNFIKFTMVFADKVLDTLDGEPQTSTNPLKKHKVVTSLVANLMTGTVYLLMFEFPIEHEATDYELGMAPLQEEK